MSDDWAIPSFLLLTAEQRKAAWERNPPKPAKPVQPWRDPPHVKEQRKTSREKSKIKRKIREETRDVFLQDRKAVAEGKVWNARTARWIDPIEAALKGDEPMPAKKEAATPAKKKAAAKVASDGVDDFGLRKDTNYARMMAHLKAHLGHYVSVPVLAKAAYGNELDLAKHTKRVVTMARKVQDKIISKKRLAYVIQKEKRDNEVCIGLFTK